MIQGTYPGVNLYTRTFVAPKTKGSDFSTLLINFSARQEYLVLLHDLHEAKQDTFINSNKELLNIVSHYFDNGGTHLYVLNYPQSNRISVENVNNFLKDHCDNLMDLEVICSFGLLALNSKDMMISQQESLEAIYAINTYAMLTDRISINDINNEIRESYLDRLGESVIYYPWFVDEEKNLIPASIIAAALNSRIANEGMFFHSIANKPIANLKNLSERLSEFENTQIYEQGINPVVNIHTRGLRVWGVKAFNSKYDSVNEMRVLKYIKRKLKSLSKPYIFEPNSKQLRGKILIKTNKFMSDLWETGALAGETKEESFLVSESSRELEGNKNQFAVEVSVAISKPLEFIVIRVSRIDNDGSFESLHVGSE